MNAYETGRPADVDPSEVDSIATLGDLASVLDRMYEDFSHGGSTEWENNTLERYLEALAALARALPQAYQNEGQARPRHPNQLGGP